MFDDTRLVISGSAVAERLGVARSTAYRYLQSLVSSRFLEEAPGGGFRLGLRVLEIGRLARRSYGLSEIAVPAMTELSDEGAPARPPARGGPETGTGRASVRRDPPARG
ncbi:helix-turn-helix domain-containing protein [Streptomyces sp. NPDC013157]|uniref:helix-turn-helix domain-containing protein n=1 Tax=Streptomyces sp. NPDC013157 TaxID=3364861 RepID=UPI0036BF23C8